MFKVSQDGHIDLNKLQSKGQELIYPCILALSLILNDS